MDNLLERLVANCSEFDEMPHSFDDTLIDKLVENIEFDGRSLSVLENFVRNIDFETRCIPIQMVIRLLDAAIVKGVFRDEDLLLEFITRSEDLLPQNRPARLLDDLFKLYQRREVFNCRRPEAWLDVIRWAITQIDDPIVSVFLRRQYQKFICQLTPSDARRLLIISGCMEIFVRRSRPDAQQNHILDAVTRLLENYATELVAEECLSYVECVRNSGRIGENSLRFLVTLRNIHSTLTIPLTPGSWHNESNRVDLICLLLGSQPDPCHGIEAFSDETNDTRVEHVEQLVDLLIYSPAVKLHHKTGVLHRMSQRQFEMFLEQLNVEAKLENKTTMGDLTKLLGKLSQRASLSQVAALFESLGGRVLESVSLLQELQRVYGQEIFNKPEFATFKARLRSQLTDMIRMSAREWEWEQTDTALEIAYIFPCFLPESEDLEAIAQNYRNSPYVMTTVLKLMRDHYGGISDELLHFYIHESADPAPKLECMKYLSTPMIFDALSIDEVREFVDAGLTDSGIEMRQETLRLAERALAKPQMKSTIVQVLSQYRNDRYLSRYVRRLLCEEQVNQENESVSIVREMLASLQVHGNEDDVPDCY